VTASYTFTISTTKPTYSGYTFLGWSTSSTATTASY
ncbi:InlB B-repeat-containing protein, partial [Candidatus Saccharibacteria bacterium]|nr:InlB B-repeat-containing protein [Candidatus Saccharibacteria bacterium]